MRSRSMPTPLVELPWGSASMSSVFRSAVASEAARLTAVVVLPTPPFWLAIAITRDIISRCLAKSYIAFKLTRTQYTSVSRETKEHTFHVKLQPWGSRRPSGASASPRGRGCGGRWASHQGRGPPVPVKRDAHDRASDVLPSPVCAARDRAGLEAAQTPRARRVAQPPRAPARDSRRI